ncbi:hypothetical protein V2J09_002668 [Rumex salicifolius]
MSGRGGRDRSRRWSPPPQQQISSSARFSDKSRPVNPPSRHLWVGNLSTHVTESVLADHFLQFGDLENLAFQPGRSYAFVNFKRDEDAIAAMNSLQGYIVAGAALRIEFAKADKMSATVRDDNYLHRRDEPRATNRNSPFSQRESRINQGDPDALLADGSRESDNATESPSKVLWISYPTHLRVDETTLRKAFSPFGEIEKISVFQGRNYAFVRFRSVMSACRAKETLHGKLFGTPRVHICFARSESGLSSSGRQLSRNDTPPNFRPTGRAGSSDDFQLDRNFRNLAKPGSNYLPPEMDYRDSDAMNFGRNETSRSSGQATFEQRRIHDLGADHRGYHNGPGRDAPDFHEFSPPKYPKRGPYPEEPWDLPEDPHLYREAKKLRTALPAENELPEYRFSDSDRAKHPFGPAMSDMPLLDEAESSRFKRIPDHSMNVNRPFVERNDHLMPPRDSFQSASGSFSTHLLDQKRITPDMPHPSMNKEWKWEGTIAKGGNAICRARCFPVGKVLDFLLPEFLDCTARTGLDMLSKHYYQATAAWVVFFVPHSDADISYYNEFMNYLGEKRRAAVSKLDDRNTLFLVPPSDFSEQVLKVPGKLSISGVVLRIELPPTPIVHSLPPTQERKDINTMPFHRDMLYSRSEQPSGVSSLPPGFSSPNNPRPGLGNTSAQPSRFSGYDHHRPDSSDGGSHDYTPNHHLQNSALMGKQGPPINQEYNSSYNNRGAVMSSSRDQMGSLQPDQLSQLASTFLGQQPRQPGNSSSGVERLSGFTGQSENPGLQRYAPVQVSQAPPGFSGGHQYQQPQMGSNSVSHGDAQEGEADTQKRLEATLQLAAALLQRIQQGKGS